MLETECVGSSACNILFKPAISLRAHVASRLVSYKVPASFEFVEEA